LTETELAKDARFLDLIQGLGDPHPWAVKAQQGARLELADLSPAGALPEGVEEWLEAFNQRFAPWLEREPKIIPAITPGIPTPRPLLRRVLRRPDSRELVEALANTLHSWLQLGGESGPVRLALGYLSALCGSPTLLMSDEDLAACGNRSLADLEVLFARRLTEVIYSPRGEFMTPAPDPQGLTWRYRGPEGAELLVEWHELRGLLAVPDETPAPLPVEPPPAPPL
jgi:hypothetical protein